MTAVYECSYATIGVKLNVAKQHIKKHTRKVYTKEKSFIRFQVAVPPIFHASTEPPRSLEVMHALTEFPIPDGRL